MKTTKLTLIALALTLTLQTQASLLWKTTEEQLFECIEKEDVQRFKKLLQPLITYKKDCEEQPLRLWVGDRGLVKKTPLTNPKININAWDKEEHTLLQIACQKKNVEVVKLLLELGADPNLCNQGESALHITAMADGHFKPHNIYFSSFSNIPKGATAATKKIVKLLITKGADVDAKDCTGKTALYYACFNELDGMIGMVMHLHGWMIYQPRELEAAEGEACRLIWPFFFNKEHKNSIKIIKLLFKKSNASTIKEVFHHACKSGLWQLVKLLAIMKAPIEPKNLHSAVRRCFCYVTTKFLLKNGADPNGEFEGTYPVYRAYQSGNFGIIKLLIDYGADINKNPTEGTLALKASINTRNFDIAAYLIGKGVVVDKEVCKAIRNKRTSFSPKELIALFKSTLPISFEKEQNDTETDTKEKIFIDFGTQELAESYKAPHINVAFPAIEFPKNSILPRSQLVSGDQQKRMDVLLCIFKNIFKQGDPSFEQEIASEKPEKWPQSASTLIPKIQQPGKAFTRLMSLFTDLKCKNYQLKSKEDLFYRFSFLLLAQTAWQKYNNTAKPQLWDISIEFKQLNSFVKFEKIPTHQVGTLK